MSVLRNCQSVTPLAAGDRRDVSGQRISRTTASRGTPLSLALCLIKIQLVFLHAVGNLIRLAQSGTKAPHVIE